jgi:hypothetical protein
VFHDIVERVKRTSMALVRRIPTVSAESFGPMGHLTRRPARGGTSLRGVHQRAEDSRKRQRELLRGEGPACNGDIGRGSCGGTAGSAKGGGR